MVNYQQLQTLHKADLSFLVVDGAIIKHASSVVDSSSPFSSHASAHAHTDTDTWTRTQSLTCERLETLPSLRSSTKSQPPSSFSPSVCRLNWSQLPITVIVIIVIVLTRRLPCAAHDDGTRRTLVNAVIAHGTDAARRNLTKSDRNG